ncbi:unnamed protein product [Chrysoparadoxa australica]
MKTNVKQIAEKLKWGYASKDQAARKGISESQWKKSQVALQRVERLFADKLQGSRTALKNAILKGRAGGLNGSLSPSAYDMSGLGEPVSIAASIAAATPVIVAAVKILKDTGLFDKQTQEPAPSSTKQPVVTTPTRTPLMTPPTPVSVPETYSARSASESTLPSPMPKPQGESGFIPFIKNNPLVAVAGVGIIGFGAYKLLGSKPKKKPSLSGTRRTTTKRKPTRKRATTRKKIQRVNLK